MLIEVINELNAPNTDKGNLLENLTVEFLRTQGYEVSSQVRVTASELDLLCKHKVSGKQVYVECKAHKDNLSAKALTNLLGTVGLHEYSEGWLVSTGPLGKDAKGFVEKWEKKPPGKRDKLSIYNPDRVLSALLDAKIICSKPEYKAQELLSGHALSLGKWILLITTWGKYWSSPVLKAGVPKFVSFFDASNGKPVTDEEFIDRFRLTDFSLKNLDLFIASSHNVPHVNGNAGEATSNAVVEVEYGEKWFDYRPARPEHFVGRKKAQRELLQFFTNIKNRETNTRVFAIKGDSGIGKSSLIAKIRDVAIKSQKPSNLFLYAVDVRAANDSSYIYSSLLAALRSASCSGFGCKEKFEVTDYFDPLQSESIKSFLDECERKREIVIIIFDQFEELYSKAELFSVFEEVKKLMFSTIAASSSIVLGFAWKTDSTVPQDHPAYHMWHQLSDHRFEILLKLFSHSDAEQSLRIFENELGEKIRSELRKYLLENSQGYPWLLKKLCIHFYEQLKSGMSQQQMANRSLNISSLFDQDLNNLTDAQMVCLKLVAQNAPMDWYEVLETAGHEVVQSLQNKRLLIKSGDKLNLYWDIFKDYVLLRIIPSIPFTYIPQSPSLDALLRVSLELDGAEGKSIKELADNSKLQESTVRNIIHDLEQFGIIYISEGGITIDNHLSDLNARSILSSIRLVFKRHALTEILKENNSVKPANIDQLINYLKSIKPTAQYHIRTWTTYSKRMSGWLHAFGLITQTTDGIIYSDVGDIAGDDIKKWSGERKRIVFLGDASPAKVVEALDLLKIGAKTQVSMKNMGYRNACAVLYRFRLLELTTAGEYRVPECNITGRSSMEAVWKEASKEESLKVVINKLKEDPLIKPLQIGGFVAESFGRTWKKTSWKRIGNSLCQWALWLMTPTNSRGHIPIPPGRKTSSQDSSQQSLFEFFGDDK